jgi:hypothetical protein
MSAVLTRSPLIRHSDEAWRLRRPGTEPDLGPGSDREPGPTLEDVVCRAWEVLGAELPAGCPVCGGELLPRESGAGGHCGSCGSSLT